MTKNPPRDTPLSSPTGHSSRRPRLVVATGNAGKAREIATLLEGTGWEVLLMPEHGHELAPVVEAGRSYQENAVLKAVAAARQTGLPALADDSGIEVDALDGRPGVLSARYGGPRVRSDRERTALLLQELDGVPRAHRTGRFRAVIALAIPGNRPIIREGVVEGRIAMAPRGDGGFGYDPVFELPDGRTMAEVGDVKQQLSHRAQALRQMADVLREIAAQPEYQNAWNGVYEMSPFRRVSQ
jgi:XTP/dITP diphosphohydrolase